MITKTKTKKITSKATNGKTIEQQTDNKQITTNKNEKKDKNEEEAEEKTCIDFYMENINPLITPHEAEVLNDYNKDLPDEVIIYAIKDAIEHKATNMKYIKKILDRYIQQGIKTIEQLKIQENIEEQKEEEYEHELTYTADDFTEEQYARLVRRQMSKEEMIQILKEKKNV